MNAAAKKLLSDALALSDSDRAELAAELISSLDAGQEADDSLVGDWSSEVERRLRELDEGTVAATPWSEARKLIMGPADGAPRR
ncbi:MAG: addiction module protein [Planctomycetes bacterium]|nr:addiction module protein [Planctomycetota bacterium]